MSPPSEIKLNESGFPPGTTRLVNIDGSVVQHALGPVERDIVLVPRPSDDPEDPLNWTPKRKWLATSCVIAYTVMVAIPSSAVYSIITPIREATQLSLTDINNGTGIMFLFYGWGCLIWQPLALQYGKRPVYLASLLGCAIVLATAPICTSKQTYLVNRILLGLAGSPVESLCEVSITDVWFAHQRPKYLAFYSWGLSMSGKLAPMLSGFINAGMGWEWTLWWCAIWNSMALIYCFLFMEETNYDRPARSIEDATPSAILSEDENRKVGHEPGEKPPGQNPRRDSRNEGTGDVLYPRKTYCHKLRVKDKPRPNRMLDVALSGLKGFSYPSVVYAGLMYGANSLVWSGIQNATAGTVYTTMYAFSTTGVAAAYSAGLLGTLVGGYYSGKVGQLLTLRLARHNNGIFEPEHLLWLFTASVFLVPFSMILYGLGVAYHTHWTGLVISQFSLAINNAVAPAASLGYAMASYPQLSGGMVTTCILIRNSMSFAINYGITPWLNDMGYRDTYIMAAVVGFVSNASIFIVIRYGKQMRERNASRYWRDVARAHAKGLNH